jgi:predicted amidophosphoribosyltransferase
MILRIAYASCYVYSPAGVGAVCERSRLLRALLKAGDAHFMVKYAGRVRQQAEESSQLHGFFRSTDILVPVPGSAPKSAAGTWVAADLADALVREGVGMLAWRGLHRICAVRKSATSVPGARPSVALHYESFLTERPLITPTSVMLIDDVVTRGRTLLAAATRLQEAFPAVEIRAFALLRTMGLVPNVRQLLDPCIGEIRWKAGDAHRRP